MINAEFLLEKLNNQKVNYDTVLRKMVKTWQAKQERPRILIHSCCAPCSTYTLEFLSQYADVTIYFANSNIHPRSEYERRAHVQQTFVNDFNEKTGHAVKFLEAPYKPDEFVKEIISNNLQYEKEGGARCSACFQLRLDVVAQQALKEGYDYFGSALTISPKKNSQIINQIGLEVQQIYDVKYLPSDFKKQGGFLRSVEMCEEYDIYRQCYCGCVFAAQQQGISLKEVNEEATQYLNKIAK